MSQSNRGAAQVSLIWVIALGVIAVVMTGAFFAGQQRTADETTLKEAAQRERDALEQQRRASNDARNAVTEVVGFASGGAGTFTASDAVKTALDEVRATFPSAQEAQNVQEALPAAIADFNGAQTRIRNLEAEVAQLRNDLAARQAEMQTAISEKDAQVATLQRTLEDERTTNSTTVTDLERQRDALRDENRDLDRRLTEANARHDAELRQARQDLEQVQGRNVVLSNRLNDVERAAETPDGTVVTVSSALRKAWIDLGREDRVSHLVQFEVLDPISHRVKGQLEVIRVEEGRAETRVLEERDPYDPIASGDLIRNPLYDPSRTPIAVLLGNGFGRFSQEDMTNLLNEVGIKVRQEIDNEVDFLILGTPFFDPDTGEEIPFSSMDAYKAAQSTAVQIVPLRDVAAWLGMR